MHRHLIAVEVGVEGLAHERMQLHGVAFHQHHLKGLDAQAVQGRGAVEQHRMVCGHLFQGVPHLGGAALNHALRHLYRGGMAVIDERAHDERLEELERHTFGQAALVQPQVGPDDDNGAAGIVDALAEQILAEAPLLAAQEVGEALELMAGRSGNGAAAPAIVDQRIHRLLEHALLVADDDFRRAQVQQFLEAVVAVDDTTVEVVEIAGGKAPAVQLDHGPQVRREYRQHGEHHPLRAVAGAAERLYDAHPLDGFLALLAGGGTHVVPQLISQRVEVDAAQDVHKPFGAHGRLEHAFAGLRQTLVEVLIEDEQGLQQLEVFGLLLHEIRQRRKLFFHLLLGCGDFAVRLLAQGFLT